MALAGRGPGSLCDGVYVENVQVEGGILGDVNDRMRMFTGSSAQVNLSFAFPAPSQTAPATLGLVRHRPRWIRRTALAAQALLRRRNLLGHTVDIWLGMASLFQLSLSTCHRF